MIHQLDYNVAHIEVTVWRRNKYISQPRDRSVSLFPPLSLFLDISVPSISYSQYLHLPGFLFSTLFRFLGGFPRFLKLHFLFPNSEAPLSYLQSRVCWQCCDPIEPAHIWTSQLNLLTWAAWRSHSEIRSSWFLSQLSTFHSSASASKCFSW